jgi:HEAT repeat protein
MELGLRRDPFLDGRESVGELICLLGHGSLRVRRAAVAALAERDPAETLPGVLSALADDSNASARSAAADVLLRYGPGIIRSLTRALEPDRHRDRTIQLLVVLGRMPSLETLEAVLPLATHTDASVAAAAIACLGAIKDPAAVPTLLGVLEASERWQTFYAIDALGEIGHAAAVSRLLTLVSDPYYRKAVLRALGKIGEESVVRPLVAALVGPRAQPDRTALTALNEMVEGARTAGVRKGIQERIRAELASLAAEGLTPGLARLLREGSDESRRHAARALGWVGHESTVRPLVEALAEPFLAETATGALANLEADLALEILRAAEEIALPPDGLRRVLEILSSADAPEVERFRIRMLDHEEDEVRQAAAAALAERAGDSQLEVLVKALGDPSPLVSSEAVRGLLRIASASLPATRDKVAGRVEGLTASPSPQMRSAALQVVARLGAEGAEQILDLALHDAVATVRRTAVSLLGESPDPDRLWRLTAALADEDARVREEAVLAVGHLQDDRARGVLLAALHDRSIWVRCRAAKALALHPAVEVQAALEDAATNEVAPVRVSAIEGLAQLWPVSRDALCRLTRDPDPEVRRAALRALGSGKDDVPLDLLATGLEDANWSVRCAAAEGLGGSKQVGAFGSLSRALDRERDAVVRRALLSALYQVDPESSLSFLVSALAEKDVAETAAGLLIDGHRIFADDLRAEWATGIDPVTREGLAVVLQEISGQEASRAGEEEGGEEE